MEIKGFPENLKTGARIELRGSLLPRTSEFATKTTFGFVQYIRQPKSGPMRLRFDLNIFVKKSRQSSLAKLKPIATNELVKQMSNVITDETFSDFVFIVKGEEFKVHKCILAAASPVWRRTFTADYKEKESGRCIIEHTEPEVFKVLLRFIYFAELPQNLSELALALFEAAHYYEIESVQKICIAKLKEDLSAKNAVEIFTAAHRYGLDLAGDAWEVIKW